jgi:hypothetical protein
MLYFLCSQVVIVHFELLVTYNNNFALKKSCFLGKIFDLFFVMLYLLVFSVHRDHV